MKHKLKEKEKMKKILQINFKLKMTGYSKEQVAQVQQSFAESAKPIANVKGLIWKVWIMNESEQTAGGIYLFKDDASVQAYLKGEIIAGAKKNPAVSNFEAKIFDILPEPTKITHGPVD
jgi:hypothetical protein